MGGPRRRRRRWRHLGRGCFLARRQICEDVDGFFDYAYPPAEAALGPDRVSEVSTVTRTLEGYEGTLDAESCDRITGEVVGPNDGRSLGNTRIVECVLSGGGGDCDSDHLDFLDATADTPSTITAATFKMVRLSGVSWGSISCSAAVGATYDP